MIYINITEMMGSQLCSTARLLYNVLFLSLLPVHMYSILSNHFPGHGNKPEIVCGG